jgi:hypothetical protein
MDECDAFAKPGHERFVRWTRRFEFRRLLRQRVQMLAQQRLEQRFSRREMAQHGCQPDVGAARDISHRRIGAMFADDVARDFK